MADLNGKASCVPLQVSGNQAPSWTLTSTLPFTAPDWLTGQRQLSGLMVLDDVCEVLLWLLGQGQRRAVGRRYVVGGEVTEGQR